MPHNPHFEAHLNHVAAVMLQTIGIEHSGDPDGAEYKHEVKQDEDNVWTLHFKKKKGAWTYDYRSWRASGASYEPS